MSEVRIAPVLVAGLEAHLLELDLLWELRESQVFADDWTLDDLHRTEARADAHLDGLLIGGDEGRRLARAALASGEPGAAAAGAHVLLAHGCADEVLAALQDAKAPVVPALCAALRLGAWSFDEARVRATGERASDAAAAGAADVLAFHGARSARSLDELAQSDELEARLLALSALGRREQPVVESTLRANLDSDAPEVRVAALRAAARGGTPGLAALCRSLAAARVPAAAEALELLGWLADPEDLARLASELRDEALGDAAACALGNAGRPEALPDLLDALGRPERAASASAAFVALTGAAELLERAARSDDELAPSESVIDPERARAFWRGASRRFERGQRYCHGVPVPLRANADFHALPLGRRLGVYLGARARGESSFAPLELERRAALQGAR